MCVSKNCNCFGMCLSSAEILDTVGIPLMSQMTVFSTVILDLSNYKATMNAFSKIIIL